jgi:hypothetical protein
MIMKRQLVAFFGFAVLLVALLPAQRARAEGTTLIVIPARYTVVQFAFDIARIRSVYLVAYDQQAGTSQPELYAWNVASAKWESIQSDELRDQMLFRVAPSQAIVVVPPEGIPGSVADAIRTYDNPAAIDSLNLTDIVNGLNQRMRFSSSEWRWLSRRYGFKLEDRNAERRRWGRYGPPGQEPVRPPRETPTDRDAGMGGPNAESLPAPARQTLVIPAGGDIAESIDPGSVVVAPPSEEMAPTAAAPTLEIEKGMPPPAEPFNEPTIEEPLPEDK